MIYGLINFGLALRRAAPPSTRNKANTVLCLGHKAHTHIYAHTHTHTRTHTKTHCVCEHDPISFYCPKESNLVRPAVCEHE